MKKRNISIATFRRLQKFNDIRALRADVFALSQRDVLASLIESRRNDEQIAHEMNKLGFRTATGRQWAPKSLRQLYKRLDMLIHEGDAKRPLQDAVSFENGGSDLERLDEMYLERLDALYFDGSNATVRMDKMHFDRIDALRRDAPNTFRVNAQSLDPYYGLSY